MDLDVASPRRTVRVRMADMAVLTQKYLLAIV